MCFCLVRRIGIPASRERGRPPCQTSVVPNVVPSLHQHPKTEIAYETGTSFRNSRHGPTCPDTRRRRASVGAKRARPRPGGFSSSYPDGDASSGILWWEAEIGNSTSEVVRLHAQRGNRAWQIAE